MNCTATDAVGNVGTLSFDVTVRDTTPPAINAPDASFTATSASGISRSDPAVASYLAGISAKDLVSGVTLTTTTPETLPIGGTKIVVTARDAAGNEARKTVTLTVLEPGKAAPPPDFTPPGPVRRAAAKAGDHVVVLTWALPVHPDLASVRIERSVVGKTGTTAVYRGLGTTFKSTGLRNDVTYRFILVAFDKAGNTSQPVVVSASPKALLLAAPKPGARVVKPPLLRWAPVASARYFNVQLYRKRNQDPLGLADRRPPPAHRTLVVRQACAHAQAGRLHLVRLAGRRRPRGRRLRPAHRQEQLHRGRAEEASSEAAAGATGRSRARPAPAGASSRLRASARVRGRPPRRRSGRRA